MNDCQHLRQLRGHELMCGRTLRVISRCACIACENRQEPHVRMDLTTHPAMQRANQDEQIALCYEIGKKMRRSSWHAPLSARARTETPTSSRARKRLKQYTLNKQCLHPMCDRIITDAATTCTRHVRWYRARVAQ